MDITNNKSLYDSMSAKLVKTTVYCLLVMLSACSTQPETNTQQSEHYTTHAEELLSKALTSPGSATSLRLEAARLYLHQEDFKSSDATLKLISPTDLSDDQQRSTYLLLKGINSVELEDTDAMTWLEQMSSDHLALLSEEDQWLWQQHYAIELARQNKITDAIKMLEHQRPLLSASQSIELSDFIHQHLLISHKPETSESEHTHTLSTSLNQAEDPIVQGWLKLALITHSNSADNFKRIALDQWQSQYPNHPAQLKLPNSLSNLPNYAQQEIKKIALLLPLNGKFANVSKSITKGFLLAAYQQPIESRPDIEIIDSSKNDFLELYQAIDADLIVGPLNRDNIKKLSGLPQLSTPTIALNAIESETPPVNLFVMNLQSEDEAKTMAKYALQKNYKTGAILTYKSKKGEKLANTFKNSFTSQEHTIAHIQPFEKNWATSIQKTLEINKSNQRARNLSRLLRSPIEFTARRRQDIEFLYAPLKYTDLRQTNPLMAFYFADDIQVLANSDISAKLYSGTKDKDLNNIIFSDFNWNPNALSITSLPSKSDASAKLYSWGADAYTAAIQLPILLAMQNQHLKGFSSSLYYNGQAEIIREFPISYVRYGKPHAKLPNPIEVH